MPCATSPPTTGSAWTKRSNGSPVPKDSVGSAPRSLAINPTTTTSDGSTWEPTRSPLMLAGDVVWIDFGIPAGSEPGFVRPAVVVTADVILGASPRTVHVVPITSNVERSLPPEVPVRATGLQRPSSAQCHLCTVISVERIVNPEGGNIGTSSLAQVRSLLADLLDIP